MTTNKKVILSTILVIFLLVSIPSIYKVVKNHRDNLMNVTNSKILLAAKKCFYEEVCKDEKITLSELYENKYLDKVYNPITKESYNDNSYVIKKESNFEFILLN